MATRTIAVDPKNLESGIEALSNAARAFRPTLFERGAYHTLMLSVDVAAWGFIALFFLAILAQILGADVEDIGLIGGIVVVCSASLGIVALALNIPLAYRLYRERARLKKLGLASLSKSLWKQSRRGRWISRAARWAPAIMLLIFVPWLIDSLVLHNREPTSDQLLGTLYLALVAALLVLSRYLRNQRERMDLAASAEELKKALQSLQQRAGKAEIVSIPSELLEQAARIESAQIAKERTDAVLQSVPVRPSGYGIAFNRAAAEQRRMLDVADRVELEDLVAQLSIEGPSKLKSQAGAVATSERASGQAETKSKRVEIEYIIDEASRGIRIIAIRHRNDPHSSLKGASHA